MFLLVLLSLVTVSSSKAVFSSHVDLVGLLNTENELIDLATDYLETASAYFDDQIMILKLCHST